MIYTSENISQLRQLVNCHVSRRLVSEKQNVVCSATLRCPSYGLFAKLFSKKRRPSNPNEGCATLRRPSYGLPLSIKYLRIEYGVCRSVALVYQTDVSFLEILEMIHAVEGGNAAAPVNISDGDVFIIRLGEGEVDDLSCGVGD